MAVNPDTHPGVNVAAAAEVRAVARRRSTRSGRSASFGVKKFGQPLYYPDSEAWKKAGGAP